MDGLKSPLHKDYPGVKASVSVSYTFRGGHFFTRRWKTPWLTLRTLLSCSKVFGSRLHDIPGKLPHGEKQRAKLSRVGANRETVEDEICWHRNKEQVQV